MSTLSHRSKKKGTKKKDVISTSTPQDKPKEEGVDSAKKDGIQLEAEKKDIASPTPFGTDKKDIVSPTQHEPMKPQLKTEKKEVTETDPKNDVISVEQVEPKNIETTTISTTPTTTPLDPKKKEDAKSSLEVQSKKEEKKKHVLDPFQESKWLTDHWNPLSTREQMVKLIATDPDYRVAFESLTSSLTPRIVGSMFTNALKLKMVLEKTVPPSPIWNLTFPSMQSLTRGMSGLDVATMTAVPLDDAKVLWGSLSQFTLSMTTPNSTFVAVGFDLPRPRSMPDTQFLHCPKGVTCCASMWKL